MLRLKFFGLNSIFGLKTETVESKQTKTNSNGFSENAKMVADSLIDEYLKLISGANNKSEIPCHLSSEYLELIATSGSTYSI